MSDVFVGRSAELRELVSALEQSVAGRGGLCLVTGDAGIGKTTLARRIADEAAHRAIGAHWGHCWDGGAPAFWPWQRILRSLADEVAESPRVALSVAELIGLLSHPGESTAAEARFALFDRCSRLLVELTRDRPLLLLFDDLHACDPASLSLLAFVARDLARAALLVVATVREPETETDPRRARAFTDLARWGRRIRLGGFTEAETGELIEGEFHVRTAALMLARIHALTEGNPLFIDEVARLLRSRQALTAVDMAIEIPSAIDKVVGERLGLLSPEVHAVVAAAAAIGREFDLARLALATAQSGDTLAPLLIEAEKFHVVTRDARRRDHFAFTHGLLGDALYNGLPLSQRQRLHGRVATALARLRQHSLAADRPSAAELAHHFSRAGAGYAEQAVLYSDEAGDQALAAYAYESAADHYRRALAALPDSGLDSPQRRTDLLIRLGDSHARALDSDGARATLDEAIRLARGTGQTVALARAVWLLGTLDMGVPRGKADEQLAAHLKEAIGVVDDLDVGLRVRLLSRLAVELHYSSAVDQRRGLCREALDLAEHLGDPRTLANTLSNKHFALWDDLSSDELLDLSERTLAAAARAGDLELEIQGRTWLVIDILQRGDAVRADRELALHRERAEALRQPRYLGMEALLHGVRELWRGNYEQVDAAAQRALAVGERVGRPEMFGNAALLSLLARRDQGRLDEADAITQMLALRAPSPPIVAFAEGMIATDLSRTAVVERVLATALRMRGQPDVRSWRGWLVAGLSAACKLTAHRECAEWLYQLGHCDAALHVVLGPNGYVGPFHHHLGLLAATLGREDDGRAHLERSIAASQASHGAPWLARSQYALAELLLAEDSHAGRRRAAQLLESAALHAERVGMAGLAADARSRRAEFGAGATAKPAAPASDCVEAIFRQEGELWTIAFGGRIGRVPDRKGIRYLAELLRNPGHDRHVLELAALCDPPPTAVAAHEEPATLATMTVGARTAAVTRSQGLHAAERAAARDLADRLEIARDLGDTQRAAEIEDQLLRLAAVQDGSANPRARGYDVVRQNVSRAIKSAIDLLGKQNPDLKLYLNATIKKGLYCSYRPDRRVPVRWVM